MLIPVLHLYLAFQSNFYERGLKDMQDKRYDAAIEDFNNAIAAEPKDFALHFNLALAYSLIGKDAEGISEYRKTLELKPGLYEAELNLGILLLRQKQPAEALPHFTLAASQKPKEFRPNYYVGEATLLTGDYPKAEAAFQAALAIDPKSAAAESGLARALAKQDRLSDAEPHFRKAAELDPKYKDSLLELAALFESHNQPDRAIPLYREFPNDPVARERIGALLIKEGKPADAIDQLEAAVAASPTPANRAALATAYIKSKQPAKAFPIIEKLVQEQPNDFELRMLYGRMLRDQRKFPEAAQEFYTATKLKPDAPETWSEFAGVLVMMENYPAALGALDKLASLHAEKPGHVYLRAIVLDRTHQIKPALESYKRFLSMTDGQFPDEEFKARQRARILQNELNKR